MLRKIVLVLLALSLLLLPLIIRWFYFYEGRYEQEEVARPDLTGVEAPAPTPGSFVDRYTAPDPGTILVDLAHENRFELSELGGLRARLAARDQRVELIETAEDLGQQLRYAKALVVITPGKDWTPGEIEQARRFVDKGGRLLLVADPTRYDVTFDEEDIPILDEDVPHINELAAEFGLLFQPDYLYNTTDNAGNFRNIKLSDFAEHGLTQGLDQVVFFAAHSITSDEPVLISAGGETRSSSSERAEPLPVAVLAAGGAVLGLGDLSFMAEPYSATYDNDRFVSNVADFLSGVRRQYELADFPFFFDDQVDLVYAGDPLLDSDLLLGGSALQSLFVDQGKELSVQEDENEDLDTLFFGLYQEAEELDPYLASAQVTLLMTTTETVAAPGTDASPDPSLAPTLELTVTPPAEIGPGPEITVTAEISPSMQSRVQIESLGEMVLTGTSLLLLQSDGERQVMIVLADTQKGLGNAVERLAKGDLQGCLLQEESAPPVTLALCPTGEVMVGDGDGGWKEPEPKPPTPGPSPPAPGTSEPPPEANGPAGSLLVIGLDSGTGRYVGMTSVEDYVALLEEQYDVTVWLKSVDGPLDRLDLPTYDLVVWSGGDFEEPFTEEDRDLLFSTMFDGIPVIISGAYVGDADMVSVQRDIQVEDATHPTANGFEPGEVVGFLPPPSGSDYEVDLLEDIESQERAVIFARGPNSDDTGMPSVFVIEDEMTDLHAMIIGFPLYLLPEEAKARLVLNTVAWMLNP